MYIDPSNYGSPMEALMCTAEEIEKERIELLKNIGGGKNMSFVRESYKSLETMKALHHHVMAALTEGRNNGVFSLFFNFIMERWQVC